MAEPIINPELLPTIITALNDPQRDDSSKSVYLNNTFFTKPRLEYLLTVSQLGPNAKRLIRENLQPVVAPPAEVYDSIGTAKAAGAVARLLAQQAEATGGIPPEELADLAMLREIGARIDKSRQERGLPAKIVNYLEAGNLKNVNGSGNRQVTPFDRAVIIDAPGRLPVPRDQQKI